MPLKIILNRREVSKDTAFTDPRRKFFILSEELGMTNFSAGKVCYTYFEEAAGDKLSQLFCFKFLPVAALFRVWTLVKCRQRLTGTFNVYVRLKKYITNLKKIKQRPARNY